MNFVDAPIRDDLFVVVEDEIVVEIFDREQEFFLAVVAEEADAVGVEELDGKPCSFQAIGLGFPSAFQVGTQIALSISRADVEVGNDHNENAIRQQKGELYPFGLTSQQTKPQKKLPATITITVRIIISLIWYRSFSRALVNTNARTGPAN